MNTFQSLLVYISAFLSNSGNYRGFGYSKFVPDLSEEKLEALVVNSKAFKANEEEMRFIWSHIKDSMFSLKTNELSLGFSPNVCTLNVEKTIFFHPFLSHEGNDNLFLKELYERGLRYCQTVYGNECKKKNSLNL